MIAREGLCVLALSPILAAQECATEVMTRKVLLLGALIGFAGWEGRRQGTVSRPVSWENDMEKNADADIVGP
jgi:hypothetical protein